MLVTPARTLATRAVAALARVIFVGLAAVCLALPARAATYDPDLTWRTLRTEHFDVHFHQGIEQLADEFSTLLEDVYVTMTAEVRWRPRRRTEIVLVDRTDLANGYAITVPYNTIVIYVTAPQENSTLSLYDDWSRTIATHEYTHILHIDANHGLARLVRAVIGRVSSTNRVSPLWMVEGFATFQETRHTTGGRGRSPFVDMIKRTSVIEDAFPPLGNLDGFQADPPGGNLRYLFGQDFMQFVSDHQGRDVWTRWVHHYGSSFPYILPGKPILGRWLYGLYAQWKAESIAHYTAQADAVRAQGLRIGRRVSDPDANCIAPAFSPDGDKLVWSCVDRATGAAIWMSDGEGYAPEILLRDRGAKNFTWRRDSKAFVFAATHTVNRFNTWSDIYLHTLGSSSISALTSGARARDPDFSPDGSRLVMVTNRAQDTNLEVMTVDRRREPLTKRTDHTQFSTPRYSPDGAVLAVSVWEAGRRDLWLYGTDGTPQRRLTLDTANDQDPQWSADARFLFFASDRTGIPNIFAIDTDTERLWQVTNVLTGAFNPSLSPDGKLLAYQAYSEDGFEVWILDLDREDWIDRGQLPHPMTWDTPIREQTRPVEVQVAPVTPTAWTAPPIERRFRPGVPVDPFPLAHLPQAPGESVDSFDVDEVGDVFGEEQDYPFHVRPRRYNPLPTLLPRYWLPYVQASPVTRDTRSETVHPSFTPHRFPWLPLNLVVSASSSASDPLRQFGWGGSIYYRNDADFVGGGLSATWNRWIPAYSVGVRRDALPYRLNALHPTELAENGDPLLVRELYWQRRTSATFQVSYPYTARTSIFGLYNLQRRETLFNELEFIAPENVPANGWLGSVQGGWRFAWAEPTTYAISVEDGRIFSLVGGLYAPWLGSWIEDAITGEPKPLTQVKLTAEIREYRVIPGLPNHVLAVRAATGISLGGNDFLGNYQLGGSQGDSAFYNTPDSAIMLRGYPSGADAGDLYWLAGLEYRFPIWRFDRGFGLFPAFVRALSGAAFVDAGNALDTLPTSFGEVVDGTLVGTGVELRLSTAVLWSTSLTGRVGYAIGWTRPDVAYGPPWRRTATPPARNLYFDLGGSF